MNFLYPYRGNQKERLIRLIGSENFFNLDPNECNVSEPIATAVVEGTNTAVVVSAVDGSSLYTRSQTVHYNRIEINQIRRGMQGYILDFQKAPSSVPEVLVAVNKVFKTDLEVVEFEEEIQTADHQVVLTVSPSSLCWLPGSKLVLPSKFGQLIDLSEIITVTELDGFWPEGLPSLAGALKVRNLSGFVGSN